MKRILIFSITYHPYIGGAEVSIQEITKRIPDVHFDMITLRLSDTIPYFEKIGNVNVYRIGFVKKGKLNNLRVKFPLSLNKYLFPFWACMQAMRLHRKHRYDLVWAMMANYAGFAAMFFKTLNPKVPYLLSLQEGDPIEHIRKRIKFIHPLFLQIFRKADRIQAISNFLKGFAVKLGYKGEVSVIPNGVDIKSFGGTHLSPDLEKLKNEIGKHHMDGRDSINGHNVVLITVSRLVEKNGVDTIIKAMQFLPNTMRLVIIGDGPLTFSLRSSLEDNIAEDRIHFVGPKSHAEVAKYLKVSDIFIRPSRSEGFGNSFVEAMAVGVPVIGTNVGGIPDFLYDPVINFDREPTGLFCEVGNPKSLAKAVMKYVDDSNLRESIIKNAKKMVEERYDWDIISKQMRNVFVNLIAQYNLIP